MLPYVWTSLRTYCSSVIQVWWVIVSTVIFAVVGFLVTLGGKVPNQWWAWVLVFLAALEIAGFVVYHRLRVTLTTPPPQPPMVVNNYGTLSITLPWPGGQPPPDPGTQPDQGP